MKNLILALVGVILTSLIVLHEIIKSPDPADKSGQKSRLSRLRDRVAPLEKRLHNLEKISSKSPLEKKVEDQNQEIKNLKGEISQLQSSLNVLKAEKSVEVKKEVVDENKDHWIWYGAWRLWLFGHYNPDGSIAYTQTSSEIPSSATDNKGVK